MDKGTLYWITGLSGAGKTTIGNGLYYKLKKTSPALIILDGDILKKLVGDSLGYSKEDRLQRAKNYSDICKLLTDQGISVIICTIAMYDSIRQWNRKNIENYVEVFLKVNKEVLVKRDRKGLYSGQSEGKVTDVAGIDLDVEFPKDPDVIIENNGEKSISQCVKEIIDCPIRRGDSFGRDITYWNNYYSAKPQEIRKASNFAQTVASRLEEGKSLIDLGCGNGRDSIFFASCGLNVTGIDISQEAITYLNELEIENCQFVCDDFVSSQALYQIQYDYFYSRWTIHAISEKQEDELLINVAGSIKKEGLFFIEVRSIHDELYGKGEPAGENAFIYNEHFRRFIQKEKLLEKLNAHGFSILSVEEGQGFSKTETSDPTLIRIIAQKK